jgi:hypothetical protein
MSTDEKARLEADVASAEAKVTRVRAENAALAEQFRAAPTDDGRELLKRAAASLAAARDELDASRASLAVFEKTGSPHGLVADEGKVTGTIVVSVKPGAGREERERAIDEAIADRLHAAAEELGVVLATQPARFTRERPGRDAEGRTVLEVAGRVEGDRLVPAVSRADKQMKGA